MLVKFPDLDTTETGDSISPEELIMLRQLQGNQLKKESELQQATSVLQYAIQQLHEKYNLRPDQAIDLDGHIVTMSEEAYNKLLDDGVVAG